MDISENITPSLPKRRLALAIAVTLGVMVSAPAFANADGLYTSSTRNASRALQQQYSLTGPIFVGPVEAVLGDGKAIRVLGITIDTTNLTADFLPAQYVAVFGTLSANGTVLVDSVAALDEVYAPGSSLVLFSGMASTQNARAGLLGVGIQAVDGLNLPGFGEWVSSQESTLVVVTGTQSIEGAPIVANTIVSFTGDSFLEVSGLGIDGSGIRGIDGSGIRGIDGSGIRGIDGSGIRGIDGSGIRGIDGSGIRGIDGSGIRGIDGSGIRGIDGSGIRGIDGSGVRGIDGSGVRGIDGSGIRGIDGSGVRGIDGSDIRGIDGSGIRGIDGSGIRGTDATDASGA